MTLFIYKKKSSCRQQQLSTRFYDCTKCLTLCYQVCLKKYNEKLFISTVPDGSKTVSTKTNISTEGAISSMAQREVRFTLLLYTNN